VSGEPIPVINIDKAKPLGVSHLPLKFFQEMLIAKWSADSWFILLQACQFDKSLKEG
jgi:hypothetical protein